MDSESCAAKIDHLNTKKFHSQIEMIKDILALRDRLDYIDERPSSTTELSFWKKKDNKVDAIILLTLSDKMLKHFLEIKATNKI